MPDSTLTPSSLDLPDLEIKPIRRAIGALRHVIRQGSSVGVVSTSTHLISSRSSYPAYQLENGEKIIIAENRRITRPSAIDGVLRRRQHGNLEWLSHRLLDDFDERLAASGPKVINQEISNSWKDNFSFKSEEKDLAGDVVMSGLRPPQIGGLHAIGMHWSLYKSPATVVMPTGTGKTETMLASLAAYKTGKLLVVVPSRVLREQTANKFLTFGLLRKLGNLSATSVNPVVGIISKRPKAESDLQLIDDAQVIVTTMSALGGGENEAIIQRLADKIDTLIVDEAHHIAAPTWTTFRELFKEKRILQFTATPFRRDGKLVDGKVIYEYPLATAQSDGYFKRITFSPIYEIDRDEGDKALAAAAIDQLRKDIGDGYDHIIMARCASKERAGNVFGIYQRLGPEFEPVLVHSDEKESSSSLEKLKRLGSRIVVCVDMLGEGFDLPQLKIAAIHDTHKSLGVVLQFTGRFTRSAGASLGEATVIANISDPNVSTALERLYSEDADWNKLLSEFSSEASKSHQELTEFLNSSVRLDDEDGDEPSKISHHLLTPPLSTLFYNASTFKPKDFHKGLPGHVAVCAVWQHLSSSTLFFVTRMQPAIRWTRARDLKDRQWDLYVLHYDERNGILYLASTDKSSTHEALAQAVGAETLIFGDVIFRSLGGINRLRFQNLGVKKHGRRNLRYAMYTGADVAEALTLAEKAGSVKSNLNGNGWENGAQVTIGCSYKGRVWYPDVDTIPRFITWSESIGTKLRDDSIDTKDIIANVLIPEEVEELPEKQPLSLEWPIELIRQQEERVLLISGDNEVCLSEIEIAITSYDLATSSYSFALFDETETIHADLTLAVGGAAGFTATSASPNSIYLRIGKLEWTVEEYFSNYPPLLRFVDLSELDGNLLVSPKNLQAFEYPEERFETWDWTGTDVAVESIWKHGVKRSNSIQERAAKHFIDAGFEFVFDDDDAGEAADLVCLKEESNYIRLSLVHCKFSKGKTAGERVGDVVEVCSQALRSSKWNWKFKELGRHINSRESKAKKGPRRTRVMEGRLPDVSRFVKLSRIKEVKTEIIMVQPGLSKAKATDDQKAVLAAAHNFLKETIGVNLDIICSD